MYSLVEFLRSLYKRSVSAFITFLVIVVGGLFLLSAFGVRLPLFGDASSASGEPIEPRLVAAPTKKTACESVYNQADSLFSTCPSFISDYSSQRKGTINSKHYNVFMGIPVANHEAQYYNDSADNLRVENGNLILEARNQPMNGYNFTSARIDTHGKEDFLYGKLVIRAKIPAGIGTWPAIWLLPSQPKYAGMTPNASNTHLNDGEIDIMEAIGTEPNMVYGIAHSLAYPEDGVNREYFDTIKIPDNNTAFHDYEVDWTPTSLTFKVDGQKYFTYSKKPNADWRSWPYDQPFYLVMNLALGGSWGGTATDKFPGNGVDKNALPASLKVQSVAYYSYIGPQ
jgi:beta-glucanase (GH16 family)